MNKKIIVANWKLNGSIQEISHFLKHLKLKISIYLKYNTIIIAPPTIYLERVYKYAKDINFFLSAQDVDIHKKGAFTGETSILMLQDIGVQYVIIGHSERRFFHNESNELIAKKFGLVKSLNLIPILCIGENASEKNQNQTKKILTDQLDLILKYFGMQAFVNTIIAYEPIWAIGTGISADPIYVQSIHKFIKDYIKKNNANNLEKLIVQYGGSVNSKNAQSFLEQPDIDGLLIGGASLMHKEFVKILQISNNILSK